MNTFLIQSNSEPDTTPPNERNPRALLVKSAGTSGDQLEDHALSARGPRTTGKLQQVYINCSKTNESSEVWALHGRVRAKS